MEHNRRPHHARPSNTAYQPSYKTEQTTKGPFYSESAFDYNFSLPPTNDRRKDTNNPSYFPGQNKDKGSVNIGGGRYQGGINPVFVSLNKEENREIMSRLQTPPPREYFPVQDYGTTKYWYDPPPSTRKPVRTTTEKI